VAKSKATQFCFYLSLVVVAKPFTLFVNLFVTELSFAILVISYYFSHTLDVIWLFWFSSTPCAWNSWSM